MTIYVVIVQLEIPQMPHNYYGPSAQIGQLYGVFLKFSLLFFRSMSQLASLRLATKPFQLHWSFQLKGPDALIRQNQQCAPSIILCILQCARLKTSKFCWLPARNTLDFGMKHPDLWEKVCLFVCFYPLWQYGLSVFQWRDTK